MTFKPGNNANPAGRPRGRIAKFRAQLGQATRDGAELVEVLAAIWRDPETPVRERREAIALALAYLLGKPEVAIDLQADVTAGPRQQLDLSRLPTELIEAVCAQIDADPTLMIEAPEDDHG